MAVRRVEDAVILRERSDRRISRHRAERFFAKLALSAANGLRMTPVFAALLCPKPVAAQLPGQSFEVTPQAAPTTVGDSVTLRFRIRLHERDQPLDSTPQVVGVLPPGVRVLSVEKLHRSASRVYEGRARVAFYRPGRRPVPTFGLPFMRIVEGVTRATLASDSAFVDITPTLAPGNPPLRDIEELERRPVSLVPLLALGLVLGAATGCYALIRRRRGGPPVSLPTEAPAEPVAPTPYQIALDRLEAVERERWPSRGNVAAHYEAVAQALRQYLEEAEHVTACERTTSELLWALPPHLSRARLRDRCHDVLSEADVVKFAEVRPGDDSAADFLRRARLLLQSWHEAQPADESVHAVR